MGINNLLKDIKSYYKILYCTLIYFIKKPKKIVILPGSCRIDTAVWMHYMDANKTAGEEAKRLLHKNAASNIKLVLAATLHKTSTIRPPASYHENYPN